MASEARRIAERYLAGERANRDSGMYGDALILARALIAAEDELERLRAILADTHGMDEEWRDPGIDGWGRKAAE